MWVCVCRLHDEGYSLDAYMRLPVSNYVNIGLPMGVYKRMSVSC